MQFAVGAVHAGLVEPVPVFFLSTVVWSENEVAAAVTSSLFGLKSLCFHAEVSGYVLGSAVSEVCLFVFGALYFILSAACRTCTGMYIFRNISPPRGCSVVCIQEARRLRSFALGLGRCRCSRTRAGTEQEVEKVLVLGIACVLLISSLSCFRLFSVCARCGGS